MSPNSMLRDLTRVKKEWQDTTRWTRSTGSFHEGALRAVADRTLGSSGSGTTLQRMGRGIGPDSVNGAAAGHRTVDQRGLERNIQQHGRVSWSARCHEAVGQRGSLVNVAAELIVDVLKERQFKHISKGFAKFWSLF